MMFTILSDASLAQGFDCLGHGSLEMSTDLQQLYSTISCISAKASSFAVRRLRDHENCSFFMQRRLIVRQC